MHNGKTSVSIILIPHNDPERFRVRVERDVLPTMAAHPRWDFELIIIDNSDEDKKPPLDMLDAHKLRYIYKRPGSNIMYGPAMNMATSCSSHPYLVYVCANHGHMYDATWIDDLINPLIDNPRIAMTGSRYPSGDPASIGFPGVLPQYHIQGGVFGTRREVLLAHPYTTDHRYVHWGSDIYEGFTLLAAGFELHHVDTINSVWRERVPSPERWKYVHDCSE